MAGSLRPGDRPAQRQGLSGQAATVSPSTLACETSTWSWRSILDTRFILWRALPEAAGCRSMTRITPPARGPAGSPCAAATACRSRQMHSRKRSIRFPSVRSGSLATMKRPQDPAGRDCLPDDRPRHRRGLVASSAPHCSRAKRPLTRPSASASPSRRAMSARPAGPLSFHASWTARPAFPGSACS